MGLISKRYHQWRQEQNEKMANFYHTAAIWSPFGGTFFKFVGDCYDEAADIHSRGGLAGIFLNEILGSFFIQDRIDSEVASRELENQIAQNLAEGNYNTVRLDLTAEVIDITHENHETDVCFVVHHEDSGCQINLRSSNGTSLEVGDRLKLTL